MYKKSSNSQISKNDEVYTPESAFLPVVDIVKRYHHAWEPCCGEGHLSRLLIASGLKVTESDIKQGPQYDLLTLKAPKECDVIITNPPFSKRKEVIQSLYSHGLPCLLLMPTTTMNRIYYEQYADRTQIIPIYGRVKFVGATENAPFDVSWFYYTPGEVLWTY